MKNKKIKLAVVATLMIWLGIAGFADLVLSMKVDELVESGENREYAKCIVDIVDNATSDLSIARVALFGGDLKKSFHNVSFVEIMACSALRGE